MYGQIIGHLPVLFIILLLINSVFAVKIVWQKRLIKALRENIELRKIADRIVIGSEIKHCENYFIRADKPDIVVRLKDAYGKDKEKYMECLLRALHKEIDYKEPL